MLSRVAATGAVRISLIQMMRLTCPASRLTAVRVPGEVYPDAVHLVDPVADSTQILSPFFTVVLQQLDHAEAVALTRSRHAIKRPCCCLIPRPMAVTRRPAPPPIPLGAVVICWWCRCHMMPDFSPARPGLGQVQASGSGITSSPCRWRWQLASRLRLDHRAGVHQRVPSVAGRRLTLQSTLCIDS